MPYYHDESNKTVICAPDVPTAHEKKGKGGAPQGWMVWAEIEITRADNYIDLKTNQWKYPVMDIRRASYDERDNLEQAIGYFKTFNYPDLPEISNSDYLRLKTEYTAIAHSNKPPATS